MDMLKTNFGGFTLWDRIEVDLAILCADLPEITKETKTKELVDGLTRIKTYLEEQDVPSKDLNFLDEEIDRYQNTKQISLYVEEEDYVDKSVIEKYSRLSMGTEGVMGIHLPYNYKQIKRLTNGVYKRSGLIKFYISREKTIYGKIIAEIYEYSQKIPIATLIESKKVDKETGDPMDKRIALFGEKIDNKSYFKIKEIEVPFYVYRFITEYNQELILFTTQRQEIGDYIVTGMVTQCDDLKALTESAKLPTKLPFFFAQQLRNRIIKFNDHGEFRSRLNHLGITKKSFFDFPFTINNKGTLYKLRHPKWFKWLVWSWITHAPVGLFNNYPLHVLIVGPPGSGKSLLLNGLHNRSKESRSIFSGVSSTLKNLVPSFKHTPAKLGYLAESNRFAYCDEFLRCLLNTRSTSNNGARDESVAIMNDLLEHQKREAGSGVSRVNVNMTARIIATTNPVRGLHSMEDMLRLLDHSFLSRILIYYQSDQHIDMIKKCKDTDLDKFVTEVSDNDWVSILDYLHSIPSEYDMNRVEKIYLSVMPILSEDLKNHYESRHLHHLECLLDGIIKTRYLFEKEHNFKAQDKDYEILEMVWKNVIKSWIQPEHIKRLAVNERIFYLPENSQWLYWKIAELKRPVNRIETEKIALTDLNKSEYIDAMMILLENKLLREIEGVIKPHFLTEDYDGTQQRLGDPGEDEDLV